MSRPLVLYGASELGRDALSVVHALDAAGQPRELLGFVDDDDGRRGRSFLDVPVLGPGGWLDGRAGEVEVLVTVGEPRVRRKIVGRLTGAGHLFATLVHPTAVLTPWVEVGEGTLIMAGATFTVEVTLGAHVVVNPGCTVAHDVEVGSFAYLSPGVDLAGRVRIGDGAYLGIGAAVIPSRTVGQGAVVGAGAVVTADVAPDRVVAGVPARELRATDAPWDAGEPS